MYVRINKIPLKLLTQKLLISEDGYSWTVPLKGRGRGWENSIKEASSDVLHSEAMMIKMFPDLEDSWCVEQVCDELGQNLAAEGQSEQESASSLSRDQLLASFGLLHGH